MIFQSCLCFNGKLYLAHKSGSPSEGSRRMFIPVQASEQETLRYFFSFFVCPEITRKIRQVDFTFSRDNIKVI